MDRHSLCIAGETNIGVGRVRNEDNYCILAPPAFSAALAVVCDGIGGHRDGDVASLYCCRRLMEEFHRRGGGIRTGAEGGEFLAGVLADINARLFRRSEFDGLKRPMGCTAICAVFTAAELAFCGAGDSRLYRYAPDSGELSQLSVDDVCPGGGAICRAVGIRRNLRVEPRILPLGAGVSYLLCSDGLHHFVGDGEIADTLREASTSRMAVGKLMRRALLRGAGDNVTIIVASPRD